MAGIKANSATKTMGDGDTAVDKVVTGYLAGEQITLSVTGSPSSREWGQALPSGSTIARSGLSSETAASPRFTPDVAGYYVITCKADGTDYVLRIQVLDTAIVSVRDVTRLRKLTDGQVATPPEGTIHLYVDTTDTLKFKDSGGTVHTVTDT